MKTRPYSITKTPLNEQDLRTLSEAVEVLCQFKGFSYFDDMGEIVSRLEDHVTSARMQTTPVIDFEKNESLKGLNHLDTIYKAISFRVMPEEVPYVKAKPIHRSQQVIEEFPDGSAIFEIEVVINQELRREFFGYVDGIQVLSPPGLVKFMRDKLQRAAERYM